MVRPELNDHAVQLRRGTQAEEQLRLSKRPRGAVASAEEPPGGAVRLERLGHQPARRGIELATTVRRFGGNPAVYRAAATKLQPVRGRLPVCGDAHRLHLVGRLEQEGKLAIAPRRCSSPQRVPDRAHLPQRLPVDRDEPRAEEVRVSAVGAEHVELVAEWNEADWHAPIPAGPDGGW